MVLDFFLNRITFHPMCIIPQKCGSNCLFMYEICIQCFSILDNSILDDTEVLKKLNVQ